jgi:hypothetical protein
MKNNQLNRIIPCLIKNRCNRCAGVTKINKPIKNSWLDKLKLVTRYKQQGVQSVTKIIHVTPVTPPKNIGVTIQS